MSATPSQEPHALCGARTRGGKTCKQPAGSRTDHPGEGRCWLHGGKTPIKHGRYSKITRTRIKELLAEFENDPAPLDLLPELALLRALILDYIERYEDYSAALLAWHQSFDTWTDSNGDEHETEKPHQITDILSVGKFITTIGQLTERIEKSKREGSVTLATLDRVVEQMGVELVRAAQETVTDEAQRAALLDAVEKYWGAIQLQPVGAGGQGRPQGP